jgi:hypothetical protein
LHNSRYSFLSTDHVRFIQLPESRTGIGLVHVGHLTPAGKVEKQITTGILVQFLNHVGGPRPLEEIEAETYQFFENRCFAQCAQLLVPLAFLCREYILV